MMEFNLDQPSKSLNISINETMSFSFNMLKQRFFKNSAMLDRIVKALSYYFAANPDQVKTYFKIQRFYMTREVDFESFKKLIIDEFVNEKSSLTAESFLSHFYVYHENDSDGEHVNKELVINEDQIQDLHKISFVMKVLIPIISDYISVHDIDDTKAYYEIFIEIVQLFNKNGVNDKLFKFIGSRVIMTSFSDKNMWEILRNTNVTQNNSVVDIYEKVINLILYKLDVTKYPISLLHIAIERQLEYKFRKKFKYSFNQTKIYMQDRNGINTYSKIESNLKRKDEGELIINELNKKDRLKKAFAFFKEAGLTVTKDELYYMNENVKITSFQTSIVMLFFSKFLDTYNFDINRAEYILMLTMLYKYLKHHQKFEFIHKALISEVDLEARKSIVKKAFITRLNNSKIYLNMVKVKYNFMHGKLLERNNPMLTLIDHLNNKFHVLPDYNEYSVDRSVMENREYLELNKNIDDVVYEFLLFVREII